MKRKMSMMTDSETDDNSCNSIASHDNNFMFGFNDSRFSDRELVIEILEDNGSGDLQSLDDGDEASSSSHTNVSQKSLRVTKLHVSSLLLAAKSPFFRKLFMDSTTKELENQRRVTVRINANEEAAFMEILNYMYSGALTSQTTPALLDVLKLAEKFQVVSCMRLCTSLLLKLPMNAEPALLYLGLTCSLTMNDEVQALGDAAKQFLIAQYKDINNVGDGIKDIPLAVVEVILSSDVLQISCEDDVFDFAHSWVESRYPEKEDQKRIFSALLGQHIRLPYVSLESLRHIFGCDIIDREFAYKAEVDALFFKITSPHHNLLKSVISKNRRRCCYRWWPTTVVEFVIPCRELVVYVDLTFNECANLKPSASYLYSETFDICGQQYSLSARCVGGPKNCLYLCFFLGSDAEEHAPLAVEYDFAARSKYTRNFITKSCGSHKFTDKTSLTLYKTKLLDFKAGKSIDAIDGILYLQVKIRIKP